MAEQRGNVNDGNALKWYLLCQPGYKLWHRHELICAPFPTCLTCITIIIILRDKLPEEVEDARPTKNPRGV